MKTTPFFGAFAACCVLALVTAPAARTADITPEVLCDLKIAEDAQLSPDGQWVTYLLSDETARGGKKTVELWMTAASGPSAQQRLLPHAATVSVARWSPRENQLAVVIATEQRRRQLVLLDPQSGTTRVLAESFAGTDVTWTPDGRSLSYLEREPATPAPKPKPGEPRILGARPAVSPTRVHVLDVARGGSRPVSPPSHTIGKFAWSPRADALVALAAPVDSTGERAVMIFAVADPSAAPRTMFVPHDQTNGLAWSPDGRTIAWTGREFTPDSGQIQLMAVQGENEPRTVQADFPGSVHNILYRPDGRLVFGALKNLRAGVYSLAADGSDLREDHPAESFAPGSLGVGSFAKFNLSFSADGSRLAAVMSGPREPAAVVAGEFGGKLVRRTALNPHVAALAMPSVEDIAWRSFDGREIHGFLVKPANFDPKRKYPMVVEVHGGPRRSWWATCFLNDNHWSAWLAQNGYVVLMPNPRGSEGRGAEFVRANRKDLGGGDWKDVVAGMHHVLRLGFVDADRLALAGFSYGGYLTAWGITRPEGQVFKAAVIGAGITNIFTRYGEGMATGGWARDHWGDELALYTQAHEFFTRSPVAHLGKVRAATLILHGDADGKVPYMQAVEFYNGLRARGVPVEGRIYPGEGHGIEDRAHRIDALNSIARWLATHVKPAAVAKAAE